MEFDLNKKVKTTKRTADLAGKILIINSGVKAKHLIQLENQFGTELSDVEKGLRLLVIMLQEAMLGEAPTFDELADYELTALEPVLNLLK